MVHDQGTPRRRTTADRAPRPPARARTLRRLAGAEQRLCLEQRLPGGGVVSRGAAPSLRCERTRPPPAGAARAVPLEPASPAVPALQAEPPPWAGRRRRSRRRRRREPLLRREPLPWPLRPMGVWPAKTRGRGPSPGRRRPAPPSPTARHARRPWDGDAACSRERAGPHRATAAAPEWSPGSVATARAAARHPASWARRRVPARGRGGACPSRCPGSPCQARTRRWLPSPARR